MAGLAHTGEARIARRALSNATEYRLMFEFDPTTFEQEAKRVGWLETLARVEELAAACLPSDACGTALDVGCGTGILLERFAKRGFQAVGLDASLDMLQAARARLPAQARLAQYDLEWPLASVGIERESCSLIVSTGALQLAPDYELRVSDFARALNPQGVLALAVPCAHPSYRWEPSCRRIEMDCLLSQIAALGLSVHAHEEKIGYYRGGAHHAAVPYAIIVAVKSAPAMQMADKQELGSDLSFSAEQRRYREGTE